MRWLLIALSILSLCSLIILPACGGGSSDSPTTSPSNTPTTSPALTAPAPLNTGDTPFSSNPVKIGAIAPWSGPMAMTGMLADTVIKLAEKQVRDMGGILGGREVKVIRYDSTGTVAGCVAGATKLFKEDKVSVLVYGGASGADNVAVSDFAEKNHILYVCYSGLPNLKELKYAITGSLTWDNWPPECRFTNEVLKPKTVATLACDTTDGRDHIEGYLKEIEGLNARVVYKEYTPLTASDYSSYLTKIKYENPDVLMLFYTASEPYMSIAKQIMELGGWGNTKVICEPGAENAAKMAGAQGWYVFEPWIPGLTYPGAVKFEQDFKAMHGKLPNSSQMYFYNPIWAAIYAIQLAGSDSDLEKIAQVARSGNLEWDSPMGRAHYSADGSANLWTMPTLVENQKLVPVQVASQ